MNIINDRQLASGQIWTTSDQENKIFLILEMVDNRWTAIDIYYGRYCPCFHYAENQCLYTGKD